MDCSNKPLPLMFINQAGGQAFVSHFMSKKYSALCQLLGRADTMCIYCDFKDLKDLIGRISGAANVARLKVYFASMVAPELFPGIPESYFGTTTLVFCAVDDTEKDVEVYYLIHPLGGIVQIEKPVAHTMVTFFQNSRATVLEKVAIGAGRPNTYKETKSVWYEIEKFTHPDRGWLAELTNCQDSADVTICLSALPPGTMQSTSTGTDVAVDWQLTLLWQLTKRVTVNGVEHHYCYEFEDNANFAGRLAATPKGGPAAGGDTGNICPPGIGCTSSVGN